MNIWEGGGKQRGWKKLRVNDDLLFASRKANRYALHPPKNSNIGNFFISFLLRFDFVDWENPYVHIIFIQLPGEYNAQRSSNESHEASRANDKISTI